jgi:hypothetical protein
VSESAGHAIELYQQATPPWQAQRSHAVSFLTIRWACDHLCQKVLGGLAWKAYHIFAILFACKYYMLSIVCANLLKWLI